MWTVAAVWSHASRRSAPGSARCMRSDTCCDGALRKVTVLPASSVRFSFSCLGCFLAFFLGPPSSSLYACGLQHRHVDRARHPPGAFAVAVWCALAAMGHCCHDSHAATHTNTHQSAHVLRCLLGRPLARWLRLWCEVLVLAAQLLQLAVARLACADAGAGRFIVADHDHIHVGSQRRQSSQLAQRASSTAQ